MISKPTVLVLGAGASAPYDYPSGKHLIQLVIESLKNEEFKSLIKQALGEGDESVQEKFIANFAESLVKSAQPSVDSFLEHRPEFIQLGKLVITKVLIGCENENKLYETDDWYQYLFNQLNTTLDEFPKNNISIITFNYDRSLEHFLFTSLISKYNIEPSKSEACLKSIPIIHVHGQIGNLPWQDPKNSRAYKTDYDINDLIKSSFDIRIISEKDVPSDDRFNKAIELLKKAEKIYFLGFGYHQTNIDRLRIKELDHTSKSIMGTRLHLTDMQGRNIQENICGSKIDLLGVQGHWKVLEFLKEKVIFD